MTCALILNGIVDNILILNDISDLSQYSYIYDTCIEIDNLDIQPGVYYSYDGSNFSPIISYIVNGGYSQFIPTGSQTIFDPFTLSTDSNSFLVTLIGTNITIGCQTYDYAWLRYAIYSIKSGVQQVNCLIKTDNGISFNNIFNFSQTDVDLVYSTLCTLV